MAELGTANPGPASGVGAGQGRDDLAAGDFAAFFRDIHDCEPFPWQRRLASQVLAHRAWPKVIDLPTGAGKTAVLDVAVFALAARPSTSPRRIVFVMDRRIVVDQVCERAERIRDRIERAGTPILERVRERLHALSDGAELGVATLRGGVPLENDWARCPDQPWIMVSTVDQFGSRLLFRGYGVTPRMRPVHAGLAGNDCLVILDEVHLSVPFAQTLGQVAALPARDLPRRFGIVEMSATPSDRGAERFTLDTVVDLEGSEELRRRVFARKEAQLKSVRNPDALPAAITKIVRSIERSKVRVGSVGVVVNRVRTARDACRALKEKGYETFLVTGRMRPLDRVEILKEIMPAIDPDREGNGDRLTVVVATQAIEVGADFSFDALITECAPVDSLRQRLGRLDRRGRHMDRTGSAAQAWIVGPESTLASKRPDPIYGDAVKATWDELTRRANGGPIDVGPRSLVDFPEAANAPKQCAPLLLQTHMDAWVQTNPEPIVQPSVEWFLRGIDRDQRANPDVFMVWRRDRSPDTLRLVPPRPAEYLPVPIDAAKSWLAGGPEVDVADAPQGREDGDDPSAPDALAVRWEGFGKEPSPVTFDGIRPGDVLVVHTDSGGVSDGTWDPTSREAVADLGDEAQLAYGRRATLRLDPTLDGMADAPVPADEVDAANPLRERIEQWLDEDLTEQGGQLEAVATCLRGHGFVVARVDDGNGQGGYYVLVQGDAETERPAVDEALLDGSDEAGSLTGTGVTLCRHLDGVGNRAAGMGERLGFSPELVGDLRLSGRLHDLGKVDERFQEQLVGGDEVALAMLDEPLAKSLPGAARIRRYPTGMRHELASVAMAESNREVLSAAHDPDLVLHLVGTHHGFGRPLPRVVDDPAPRQLDYTLDGHALSASSQLVTGSLGLDMADRFWRLVGRYGHHGLAWLEAILRLADHQQSAEESSQ